MTAKMRVLPARILLAKTVIPEGVIGNLDLKAMDPRYHHSGMTDVFANSSGRAELLSIFIGRQHNLDAAIQGAPFCSAVAGNRIVFTITDSRKAFTGDTDLVLKKV